VRILRAILLVPVLLALSAAGASASSAAAGLDPSFGNGGKTTVAVPGTRYGASNIQGMALSPDGRTYVLEHSLLLAFEADGKPAAGFGAGGRVAIDPVGGEGEVEALAVDSQGRVLVTGSAYQGEQHHSSYSPVYAAYVIRYLPDGDRDVTFGSDGEVQTTFGLPRPAPWRKVKYKRASVMPTTIVVDSMDRPIVGGGFVTTYEGCGSPVTDPFVGRLTASGALDTTFAGKGHALAGGHGSVSALARTPEGGPATLSFGVSCGARVEEEPSTFSTFTESGEPAPGVDSDQPQFFAASSMAIDPQGRILVIRVPPPVAEGHGALVRLLPNGDLDPGFGKNGAVVLKGALAEVGAFTVDAQSRPILAPFAHGIELRRLTAGGAADPAFGPGGRLFAKGSWVQAVQVDGQGRIYTASAQSKKLKTGFGIQVARFLPGS
jgi:uncharacterized delta-60 repeat protein